MQLEPLPGDFDLLQRADAAWTMAAAQQVPEHGFRLVVGVVGEHDAAAAVPGGAFGKEFVPRPPGCGFDRFAGVCGRLTDVDPADQRAQAEGQSGPLDELRVGGGDPAAQPVVEVADDQIPEAVLEQQMQESHRVGAA